MSMETRIAHALTELETKHNVKVIYACESGSRAWDFASPDSDYDVRFFYVRPLAWYLRTGKNTLRDDTIDVPISDELDLVGWDLRKALGLLRKGNAATVEWLHSPIIYRNSPEFVAAMQRAVLEHFPAEYMYNHYASMATTQLDRHLQEARVKLKKYFYTLRPILAAQWIKSGRPGCPPLHFETLLETMVQDPEILTAIRVLLDLKREQNEIATTDPRPLLHDWIHQQVADLPLMEVPWQDPAIPYPEDAYAYDQLMHHAVTVLGAHLPYPKSTA